MHQEYFRKAKTNAPKAIVDSVSEFVHSCSSRVKTKFEAYTCLCTGELDRDGKWRKERCLLQGRRHVALLVRPNPTLLFTHVAWQKYPQFLHLLPLRVKMYQRLCLL
jgi:hypothetical protein